MRNEIAARRRCCVNRLHKPFRSIAFLLAISWTFRFIAEKTNASKDGLEPLHLIGTSRCASRGKIHKFASNVRRCVSKTEWRGEVSNASERQGAWERGQSIERSRLCQLQVRLSIPIPLAELAGLDYPSFSVRSVKEHALSVGKEKRSETAQTPGRVDTCSSFHGSRAKCDSITLCYRPYPKFTSRGFSR